MKKALLTALIISTLLISLVAGVQVVGVAKANWIVEFPKTQNTDSPLVTILTPLKNGTLTNTNNVTITFCVTKPSSWNYPNMLPSWPSGTILYIRYITDGQEHSLFEKPYGTGTDDCLQKTTYYDIVENLSDGLHSLVINVSAQTWYHIGNIYGNPGDDRSISLNVSEYICFTVDTVGLKVSLLAPENKTYNQVILPLNFTTNEPTSWIGYSLDNEANVTLTGNTTLEVHAGFHTLVIYANDTAGNMGASDTVEFTLQPNLPTPTSSPSPTQQPTIEPTPPLPIGDPGMPLDWILYAIISITIVSVGIAVYALRKVKHRNLK